MTISVQINKIVFYPCHAEHVIAAEDHRENQSYLILKKRKEFRLNNERLNKG